MSAPSIPKPPGLWRALARDAVLSPQERAARAAALAELRRRNVEGPDDAEPVRKPEKQSPRERLAPYQPILHRAGWRVRFAADDDRARIEAFHPDGAAVMLTAAPGRSVNTYVLHASLKRPSRWLVTTPEAVEYFAAHCQLPSSARRWRPASKCHCGKKGRFPTEEWAKQALTNIQINKELRQKRRATERRVYRCPDDDRVWHITSRTKWHSGNSSAGQRGAGR